MMATSSSVYTVSQHDAEQALWLQARSEANYAMGCPEAARIMADTARHLLGLPVTSPSERQPVRCPWFLD